MALRARIRAAHEQPREGLRRTASAGRQGQAHTEAVDPSAPSSERLALTGRDYCEGGAPPQRAVRATGRGAWREQTGVVSSWARRTVEAIRGAVVTGSRRAAATARAVLAWAARSGRSWGGVVADTAGGGTAGTRPGEAGCPRAEILRDLLLEELAAAAEGRPRVTPEEVEMAGGASALARMAQVRTHRALATRQAGARYARQAAEFLRLNEELLAVAGRPTGDAYDILVEAWTLTRCRPAMSRWQRSQAIGRGDDTRVQSTLRGYLDRLGYSRGATWPRTRAMAQSIDGGGGDANHALPVFAWEVAEGLRGSPVTTIWEQCGAALVTTTVLAARRRGAATSLLVGQVRVASGDAIEINPRQRPKPQRDRPDGRARRQGRPVLIKHWMVRVYVIPWVRWHEQRRSPPTARLFPAITRDRPQGRGGDEAVRAGGMWYQPSAPWTARQLQAMMDRFVAGCGGRTVQGLRSGNNIELRRFRDEGVSDVTRRTLHERSVQGLIGSEVAYNEVFAEDMAAATTRLGSLRIERSRRSQLLSVTARNPTAGEDPGAWEPLPSAVWLGAPQELAAEAEAGDDEEDDDVSADSGSDVVVGDGGRETRRARCQRCGVLMGDRDYGYLCDHDGCSWAVCPSCHPGGTHVPLWCPQHKPVPRALIDRGTA